MGPRECRPDNRLRIEPEIRRCAPAAKSTGGVGAASCYKLKQHNQTVAPGAGGQGFLYSPTRCFLVSASKKG
jgi:hypothetical protein